MSCVKDEAEVYISPKINISARTLKMAVHKNPVMHSEAVKKGERSINQIENKGEGMQPLGNGII